MDSNSHRLSKSSQSVQKIILISTDSLSNSSDTPALSSNKLPQLQGITLTPTISISSSSEDTPALNVNETPITSISANLSCISNSTKSQNQDKNKKEQTITEIENLRAEMIALKSFVMHQIYMVKKKIK